MKTSITALAVFVASALCAAPPDRTPVISGDRSTDGRYFYIGAGTLTACKAAKNCEILNNGTAIRFIPGQEPGTAAYDEIFSSLKRDARDISNLSKRESFTTHLQAGSPVINYGTTYPADAVQRLWGACQYYSCDATPMNVDTKVQGCNSRDACDENLVVTASGQYNGWAHRNNLVTAISDISQQGQLENYVHWLIQDDGSGMYNAHWEVEQSGFFSVNIFSNGYMVAWMQVRITHGAERDKGCQRVRDNLGYVREAINGIGPGFFGSLLLDC